MRSIYHLVLFALIVSLCPVSGQTITHHPLASPSRLEVNLGPVAVDAYYTALNCIDSASCATDLRSRYVPECSNTITLRQCYISAFQNYASQGITGVRFQFGICGGFYSTPLHNCGQPGGNGVQFDPQGTWLTSLWAMFNDLHYFGINNITLTPAWEGFGGDTGVQLGVQATDCHGKAVTVDWWPASVYPIADGVPYGGFYNDSYNCAPANPNFVGWSNLYNTIAWALYQAKQAGLTVEELDLRNELDLFDFTVLGRLIYDVSRGEPVLYNMQSNAQKLGVDPNSILFSITGSNADAAQQDCVSAYGDSARMNILSAQTAALSGLPFGFPVNESVQYGLNCGGTTSIPNTMAIIPMSFSQPKVVDVHYGPCLEQSHTCISNQSQDTVANEGKVFFNGIASFLQRYCPGGSPGNSPELCNALFMLGEVPTYNPNNPLQPGFNCDGSLLVIPDGTIQGINMSSLAGRRVNGSAGVVVRPFENPTPGQFVGRGGPQTQACDQFPLQLAPTFVATP